MVKAAFPGVVNCCPIFNVPSGKDYSQKRSGKRLKINLKKKKAHVKQQVWQILHFPKYMQ